MVLSPVYMAVLLGIGLSVLLEAFKAPTWGPAFKKALAAGGGVAAGLGLYALAGGDPLVNAAVTMAFTYATHSAALQGTAFGQALQGIARVLHGLPPEEPKQPLPPA